jgi:hypothetical protein
MCVFAVYNFWSGSSGAFGEGNNECLGCHRKSIRCGVIYSHSFYNLINLAFYNNAKFKNLNNFFTTCNFIRLLSFITFTDLFLLPNWN